MREAGRIVGCAVILAVTVNEDGRREVLGVVTGPSEAETFRTRRPALARPIVACAACDSSWPTITRGLQAAARRVFDATHQRCRAHWMRNALAQAATKSCPAVAAMLETAFAQEAKAEAQVPWDAVADALHDEQPRLAAMMGASCEDVLACMGSPRENWAQIAFTTPPQRVDK